MNYPGAGATEKYEILSSLILRRAAPALEIYFVLPFFSFGLMLINVKNV